MSAVAAEIAQQVAYADRRYGPFTSTHEGYGVLAEEVAELLDAIRSGSLANVRAEAIQVAAVAARIARACEDNAAFSARSGK